MNHRGRDVRFAPKTDIPSFTGIAIPARKMAIKVLDH
jgi:hypothetical protein